MEGVLLEPKLELLIQHCATICEPQCCGIDACDFSPFHLATFFLYGGKKIVNEKEVQALDIALSNVLANYGSKGASSIGSHFSTIGYLSGEDIDDWIKSIRLSMVRATKLINEEYRK